MCSKGGLCGLYTTHRDKWSFLHWAKKPHLWRCVVYQTIGRGLVSVVACTMIPWSSPAEEVDGPRIHFAETSYNVGTVSGGDTVEHAFRFVNDGSAELVIYTIGSSCACSAGVLDDADPKEPSAVTTAKDPVIQPGDSSKVLVKMRVPELYGGEYAQSVQVYSNDPFSPRVDLRLSCRIDESLVWHPRSFVLGGSRLDSEKRVLWIRSSGHIDSDQPRWGTVLAVVHQSG